MEPKVNLNVIYVPSDDVVAREVQGEFIIIPITSGVGDEDEIFTLNETGRAIWDRLDGKRTLKDIVTGLSEEFEAPLEEIEKDVLGLIEELLKRKMLADLS
jgi:hypothetical protein